MRVRKEGGTQRHGWTDHNRIKKKLRKERKEGRKEGGREGGRERGSAL